MKIDNMININDNLEILLYKERNLKKILSYLNNDVNDGARVRLLLGDSRIVKMLFFTYLTEKFAKPQILRNMEFEKKIKEKCKI